MTAKQSFLKTIYPFLMKAGEWFGVKAGVERNVQNVQPALSFYKLHAIANNNNLVDFSGFKGKKVLLVNTASACGYTGQLSELQELQNEYKDRLVVIGFPANDFREQEKGTDEEIASFCTLNYGVDFPLMKKSVVVKSGAQNDVYKWLTDQQKNGWNNKAPEWNFSKYLVNDQGILTHYFGPAISPLSNKVRKNL